MTYIPDGSDHSFRTAEPAPAVLRTPPGRLAALPDHPFEPHYIQVGLGDGSGIPGPHPGARADDAAEPAEVLGEQP